MGGNCIGNFWKDRFWIKTCYKDNDLYIPKKQYQPKTCLYYESCLGTKKPLWLCNHIRNKTFLVTSIVVAHRAWQVTVGKLFQAGPFGELNLMPMSPQFKKNCKLPDFFPCFLSNSIAERHDAIKALCFSISLCAVSFYFHFIFSLCNFSVHWWSPQSAGPKYLTLSSSWATIRLMWGSFVCLVSCTCCVSCKYSNKKHAMFLSISWLCAF